LRGEKYSVTSWWSPQTGGAAGVAVAEPVALAEVAGDAVVAWPASPVLRLGPLGEHAGAVAKTISNRQPRLERRTGFSIFESADRLVGE